ncbi:Flp family type IVb pilin [Kocuria sp. CPCC 205292]|uniref:Flp family type IVb pilin n=1 Tax=Kocuria cellulosilytica TaxID=3071451 RepID=UPI0034D4B9E4
MLPLLITLQSFFTDTADRLKGEQKGATAVEYGLIVGLIAVVIITAVGLIGDDLAAMFQNVANELTPPVAG